MISRREAVRSQALDTDSEDARGLPRRRTPEVVHGRMGRSPVELDVSRRGETPAEQGFLWWARGC